MSDAMQIERPEQRQIYSAPQLTIHGDVVELTASGSKGRSESENWAIGLECYLFNPGSANCRSRRG